MKKLDVKTVITFGVLLTLCISTLIVVIADVLGKDLEITDAVITLFTNATTAVITYFFTRKSIDSEHKKEE